MFRDPKTQSEYKFSPLSKFIFNTGKLWKVAGEIESAFVGNRIKDYPIQNPVFICGFARSGSTLILEKLFLSGKFESFRYADFPMLFTPVIWRKFYRNFSVESEKSERFHRDRIKINESSPEAFEEVLWKFCFTHLHNEDHNQIMGSDFENEEFEEFYKKTLSKLLYSGKKRRYLAKSNYNLFRIEYIKKIFPDAKFVIPYRDPVGHVFSLMKQHRLISEAEEDNPDILKYMDMAGHYEFGLGRKALNLGNSDIVTQIRNFWQNKEEEHKGWGLLWKEVYGYVVENILQNKDLKDDVLLVDYNKLCDDPEKEMAKIYEFCSLPYNKGLIEAISFEISKPDYYEMGLNGEEIKEIEYFTSRIYDRIREGRSGS